MTIKNKIIAALPMFCAFVFLFVGFVFDVWHPTWVIFLLIPIAPVILYSRFAALAYPTFCVIVFLLLGFLCDLWHPGWLIFLTIPIFNIFFDTKNLRKKKDKEMNMEYIEIDEENK